MLVKMDVVNANPNTKPILRSLPLDSEPTIDHMIKACVKHSSAENTVAQAVAPGDWTRNVRSICCCGCERESKMC